MNSLLTASEGVLFGLNVDVSFEATAGGGQDETNTGLQQCFPMQPRASGLCGSLHCPLSSQSWMIGLWV